MVKKIHYHSDCHFFAGCENMLVNFFDSKELNDKFKVSFSYRKSIEYEKGLNSRVKSKIIRYPLNFLYLLNPRVRKNKYIYKIVKFAISSTRVSISYLSLLYEIFVLTRLLLKINPDIVHVNSGGYPPTMSAKAAVIAAKFCKVDRVIMVVNNLARDYTSISRMVDYPLDRVVVASVDYFITGSMSASNKLKQVLSLDSKVIMYIHNGIELRKRQESNVEARSRLGLHNKKIKIFGVVALLIHRKGHKVLIDSIENIVKKSVTNLIVLIEGSGPLKVELEREIKLKRLERYCRFVGNEKNIVDFISILDFVVLPSIEQEDFPNVILESMALGKIVLASNLSGIPEQIKDQNTGFIFNPGDFKHLSLLMTGLIKNNTGQKEMGKSAKKRFDNNFNAKIAVKKYIDLYES